MNWLLCPLLRNPSRLILARRCVTRLATLNVVKPTLKSSSRQQQQRTFFFPSASQSRTKFNETAIVNAPQEALFDLVMDIEQYHQFVPNCLAGEVLERQSAQRMRAKITLGLPHVVSLDYTSTVLINRPTRILTLMEEHSLIRFLESEWIFEPLKTSDGAADPHRTLVKVRAEFELHSQVTAGLLAPIFDAYTQKTTDAFIKRAELMYRKQRLQQARSSTIEKPKR